MSLAQDKMLVPPSHLLAGLCIILSVGFQTSLAEPLAPLVSSPTRTIIHRTVVPATTRTIASHVGTGSSFANPISYGNLAPMQTIPATRVVYIQSNSPNRVIVQPQMRPTTNLNQGSNYQPNGAQYLPPTMASPQMNPPLAQPAYSAQPSGTNGATSSAPDAPVAIAYYPQPCPQSHPNSEADVQAYMSKVEAITGTMSELDEAVQSLKATRSCDEPLLSQSPPSSNPFFNREADETDSFSTASTTSPVDVAGTTAADVSTTTESFTDAPFDRSTRAERNAEYDAREAGSIWGMPNHSSTDSSSSLEHDQAEEDLTKASNDLKILRKDLSMTAEWLKQTNHTIHSVMLRALQAYVTSIERRVDQQRQLYKQTRGTGLKKKISAIKEKVAILMEKLKSLVPFKQPSSINRADQALPQPSLSGPVFMPGNHPNMVGLPAPVNNINSNGNMVVAAQG